MPVVGDSCDECVELFVLIMLLADVALLVSALSGMLMHSLTTLELLLSVTASLRYSDLTPDAAVLARSITRTARSLALAPHTLVLVHMHTQAQSTSRTASGASRKPFFFLKFVPKNK